MQIPPLAVLASWPSPNYVNPVKTGSAIIVMHAILFPTAFAIVCMRVFARVQISKAFGLDDALIVTALIPTTAFVIVTLYLLYHLGWDRHIWDVLPGNTTVGLKLTLVSEILFSAAGGLTRLSMLIMTQRIMATSKGFLRTFTNCAVVFIILEHCIFFIVVIFSCRPISAQWTVSFKSQTCINIKTHLLVAGILNTFSDFLVVLLPIPIVLRLQLPIRQMAIVIMLFGAGFIVVAAGGARTWYTHQVSASFDSTWYGYRASLSSSIELYIGIICASVPPTKAFFMHYLPKLLSSVRVNTRNSKSPTNSNFTSNSTKSSRTREGSELASIKKDAFMKHTRDASSRSSQEHFGWSVSVQTSISTIHEIQLEEQMSWEGVRA